MSPRCRMDTGAGLPHSGNQSPYRREREADNHDGARGDACAHTVLEGEVVMSGVESSSVPLRRGVAQLGRGERGGIRRLRPVRSIRVIGFVLLASATAGVIVPSAAAAGARGRSAGKAPSSLLYAALNGVAATSARNVWAVGQYQSGTVLRTLIVHWNGKTWRQVPSPNPARSGDTLSGVAATSTARAWAVGEQNGHSLLLGWNGKSWRRVRCPDIGNLAGVAATSAANAWAVGIGGPNGDKTAIEHWNGRAWRVAPSPVKVGNLLGVAATSASNAWAVGFSGNPTTGSDLAEHWNGKAWRVVHSPAGAGGVIGVAATSASNAWAVGGANGQSAGTSISVINHWNGGTWRRIASPNPVPGGATFFGVAVTSASNAWAVGTDFDFFITPENVIAHWNGKAWKLVPSPIHDGSLNSVTATSAGSAWAVGSGDSGALIEHWNGTRWKGTTFG